MSSRHLALVLLPMIACRDGDGSTSELATTLSTSGSSGETTSDETTSDATSSSTGVSDETAGAPVSCEGHADGVARHVGLRLDHHDAPSDAEACARIMVAAMS